MASAYATPRQRRRLQRALHHRTGGGSEREGDLPAPAGAQAGDLAPDGAARDRDPQAERHQRHGHRRRPRHRAAGSGEDRYAHRLLRRLVRGLHAAARDRRLDRRTRRAVHHPAGWCRHHRRLVSGTDLGRLHAGVARGSSDPAVRRPSSVCPGAACWRCQAVSTCRRSAGGATAPARSAGGPAARSAARPARQAGPSPGAVMAANPIGPDRVAG